MCRLILVFLAAGMLAGCGRKAVEEVKAAEGTRRGLQANAGPAQVAEDFLAESWKGSQCDILSVKEHSTTLRQQPATVVHVQWKVKGEDELRNDVLLIQGGRVKDIKPYDTGRSFEENAVSMARQLETP